MGEVFGDLAVELGEDPGFFLPPPRPRGFFLTIRRPTDHIVLQLSGVGLTIAAGPGKQPARLVRAEGALKARLIVDFGPQHTAEQVFQEKDVNGDPETPVLPAGARFAAPSRLAFEVAAGVEIELTFAGVLEAMSHLPLAVVPLATPRRIWLAWLSPEAVSAGATLVEAPEAATRVIGALTAQGRALGRATTATMERVRATKILAASPLGSIARDIDARIRATLVDMTTDKRAAALVDIGARGGIDQIDLSRWLRNPNPRPPAPDETAIEIPSRLQLSPSNRGAWAHAISVDDGRGDGTGPVELWHSRLGVRAEKDGQAIVDEIDTDQRVVRGVWTRDLSTWSGPPAPLFPPPPFRMSTSSDDRYQIVGRSTGAGLPILTPVNPVDVNRLALTSIGTFLDVRGVWPESDVWSLLEWQHRATLGRDQYIKVVYDGYLFPFGHRAVLIKETRRKVDPVLSPPVSGNTAILWQRYFLILKERTRDYPGRSMPFTSITLSPTTTPDINDPGEPLPRMLWPRIGGDVYRFTVRAVDQDGDVHVFPAPLLWVEAPMDAAYAAQVLDEYGLGGDALGFIHKAKNEALTKLGLNGKRVAVAPSGPSGEATYETHTLRFAAQPGTHTSNPQLFFGELVIPAVSAMTGQRTTHALTYAQEYLNAGFDATANAGEVVLGLARDATAQTYSFASSDKSGGFLNPGQVVEGLSRRLGPVADLANVATSGAQIDPAQLFGNVGKLFGLFDIADLLEALGLGQMPAYVSKIVDIASALDGDLTRVVDLLPNAPPQVAAAKTQLQTASAALDALMSSPPPDVEAQIQALITNQLLPAIDKVRADALAQLERAQQTIVGRTLDTLETLLKPPTGLPVPPPAQALASLARGEPVANLLNHVHLEWSPPLKTSTDSIFNPTLDGQQGSLLLAVDVRGGDLVAAPSTAIVAQLTNFSLDLIPGTPLLSLGVERIMFAASTGKKTDVDVAIGDLQWKGILGFVDDLRQLIPLDGFSDPPSLTVDESGISSGFSVELPNLAIGVFNLSNLSLAADIKLPFLGTAPSVGFAFCSRERPFVLGVMIFGGGGFFGIRLNPKEGVVLLEAALEFGAYAAIDFVVASGSVSCMAGIYFRLESSNGSLTGYLRIRGEVDVLGLISAAIEMYMGLTYEFGSGKVLGQATISVEVEVLMFSETVKISAERRFAGSAGDPTFAQALGPYSNDGPWVAYCQAFAGG
jgi:hypothetical protein